MRPGDTIVAIIVPDVLSEDALRKVLATCSGDAFDAVRDTAILRAFMTTGARLSEIATLRLDDVVMTRDQRHLDVLGKGRKRRLLPLDNRTARALNRYVRERRRRPGAGETSQLWLGHAGPMTVSGVSQVVRRRGA